jgi:hypothetical protein
MTAVWDALREACSLPWMGIYLRLVGIMYAFGAVVHLANILGLGGTGWKSSPISWKVLDVAYALLDSAVVVGLWMLAPWGVICFLAAALSQILLYTLFRGAFARNPEHVRTLRAMVSFHVATLIAFAGLLVLKR